MGVKTFSDALVTLLTTEETFTAALSALLGQPVVNVQRSNVPWSQISANMLPLFVVEQGDGNDSAWGTGSTPGLVIGHSQQDFESELDVCLIWDQQDRDTAADQRAQLPDLFAQLMLRNPQPGGVNAAWLKQWVPDQGVLHPRQCWVARIHADYTIEQTP